MKRVRDLSNIEVDIYLNKLTIQEKRQLLVYHVGSNEKEINLYTDPRLYKDIIYKIIKCISPQTYSRLRRSCKFFYNLLSPFHPIITKVVKAFQEETYYVHVIRDFYRIRAYLIRRIVYFMKLKGIKNTIDLNRIPISFLNSPIKVPYKFKLSDRIYLLDHCIGIEQSIIFPILDVDIKQYFGISNCISPNEYTLIQRSHQNTKLKNHSNMMIEKMQKFYKYRIK